MPQPSQRSSASSPGTEEEVSGVLELDPRRFGFLRSAAAGLRPSPADPYVSPDLIARFGLRTGVVLSGRMRPRPGKNPSVHSVGTINGLTPDAWGRTAEFSTLEAVTPREIIRLEHTGCQPAARIIDLFSPIGKGQRALIVSPPKAGKTMLMQHIAHAVSTSHPDIDLLVLLIDERPEEVTDMRRTIRGEVFASSSDSERGTHVRIAQLVLEYARRKVETGRDVVILLDSLTRLGRAFNLHQRSSGRTMSGGVDARALEIPKRIFGAARAVEHGGSLTIVATALVDTGSRMDELIFQEFKGTGNMELVLNRDLANERIFPAIHLNESGTRREELLYGPDAHRHHLLRRLIARKPPREAMLAVEKLLAQHPTNRKLLEGLPGQ